MTGERLRSAVIAADRSIVAAGSHGLYHFARGVWSALHMPAGIDARFIRGIARMPAGELLLFGDNGFAITLSPGGIADRLPAEDRDITFLGAHIDNDAIALVGERLSRPIGVLVELTRGSATRVRSIDGTTRLHAVTRLGGPPGIDVPLAASDSQTKSASAASTFPLIVCGIHGDLFEVDADRARPIPWGRTGHLYALAPALDGGAYCVGSGGHALRIWRPPAIGGVSSLSTATLEAVQTTRDLTSVVVDEAGSAWAVGGQARLLERRNGVWTRIPLDSAAEGPLCAVSPRADAVTVLGEDGMVLEGRGIA